MLDMTKYKGREGGRRQRGEGNERKALRLECYIWVNKRGGKEEEKGN